MSSQKTTGHRKKDTSSSYVDLPRRETEISANRGRQVQWCAALLTREQPLVYGNEVGGALSFPRGCSQLLSRKEAKGNSRGGQRGAGWGASSSRHLF